jgi:hypothetical protein
MEEARLRPRLESVDLLSLCISAKQFERPLSEQDSSDVVTDDQHRLRILPPFKMVHTVVVLGGAYAGLHVSHYLLKNNKDVKIILVSKVSRKMFATAVGDEMG